MTAKLQFDTNEYVVGELNAHLKRDLGVCFKISDVNPDGSKKLSLFFSENSILKSKGCALSQMTRETVCKRINKAYMFYCSDICSDIYADFWIEVISMANDPDCKLNLNDLLQAAIRDTLAKHQAKQPCIS